MPSIVFSSTIFGPVHPFGEVNTIIGYIGLSITLWLFAYLFIALISLITLSMTFAIFSWADLGFDTSTKYGFQPHPTRNDFNSLLGILDKTVGLDILYPFKCSIGKTIPSFLGFMILFKCQLVASGPVSASPSPTIHDTIRSGLSKTAPKECTSE